MQMNTASMFGYSYGGESQHETQLRELRAKERMLKVCFHTLHAFYVLRNNNNN